ncbi:MAG: ABC transporter permease [Chloroflexi bacterium]|nr:ABC transporter permease [Chloroflexota bacterium]MBV9597768.1 ABC transporter permease [Chloroflexota bacterium]
MALSIRESSSADLLPPSAAQPAVRGARRWQTWYSLRRNPIGLAGLVIIGAVIVVAVLGPVLWSTEYSDQAFRRLQPPSTQNPMGTDNLGRDVLARVIHGAQVSLQVASVAVGVALAVGLLTGVFAALYGGKLDGLLMRLVDIMFAVPGLVLAILIAGLLGPSRTNAMIAIGIVYAPVFARVARGTSLSVLSLPYVEAAQSVGVARGRMIWRYLLPNIAGSLIVLTSVYLSSAILTEASLSFLGLGAQPPEPSWGGMLNDSRTYMELAPWLAVFPGLAIMLVVLGFNFLGDGLRDVLDPRR